MSYPARGRSTDFDLNGDGIHDVVWESPFTSGSATGPDFVVEYDSLDGGALGLEAVGSPPSTWNWPTAFVADLDGSNAPAILVESNVADGGWWLQTYRLQDGGFSQTYETLAAAVFVRAVFDVDGDGIPDLVGSLPGANNTGDLAWVRGPCY